MSVGPIEEQRLTRLLEVGRSLVSELDLEAVLERVLDVARELSGARYAAVGILDEEGAGLDRFITAGIDDETRRIIGDLPHGRGILGELIRDPKPLRLEEISAHPRSYGFPPGHPPMSTFLGAPILVRDEVYGNIYLSEKEGAQGFDERDQETLVVLADWAAVAIGNARLYSSVNSRRQDLERAVQGLEATTAIASAVAGETDLSRVVELVAKRARALIEARSVLILLADGGDLLVAAVAGEADRRAEGTRIQPEGTVLAEVLREGRVERLEDVGARVRLGLGDLAPDPAPAIIAPLTFRGRAPGLLVALGQETGAAGFTSEDERVLRAFASSAATAVVTAQSVEAEHLKRSIGAAEQERGRWARELHDETLQGLGGLQILLSTTRAKAPEPIQKTIDEAIGQIESQIENLHVLITELRPAALDDLGLAPALEALFERFRTTQGIELQAEVDLAWTRHEARTRLTSELASALYRIVQESLNNIAKHARASRVTVTVKEAGGEVTLTIGDDGRGFDSAEVSSGFGLVGLRERVSLAGGRVKIDSTPGGGTTIRCSVPAIHAADIAPPARSA